MNRDESIITNGCINCKYLYKKKLLFMETPNAALKVRKVKEIPFCKLHCLYIDWDLNTGCDEWKLRDKPLPIITLFSSREGDDVYYNIIDKECLKCGISPIIIGEGGGCVREFFICINCEESLSGSELDELRQEIDVDREYYILEEGKFKFGEIEQIKKN